MSVWRRFLHGARAVLHRSEHDRDIADEVRHFMDEAEAELVSRGVSVEDARRTVRLRFGDGLAAREDIRASGWEGGLEALLFDLRSGSRRLRHDLGFSFVVIVTLALGVGSSTAIFSVVRPTLLDRLGYPDPDRIVSVAPRAPAGGPAKLSFGTFVEVRERTDVFAALAAFKPWQPTLTGEAEPIRLNAQRVSAEYFDVLGIRPVLGPGFDPAADRPGGEDVVVLSHDLWRMLGSRSDVVGTMVRLDGAPYRVVGVMGEGFDNAALPGALAWGLLQYDAALEGFDTREWGNHLDMLARLHRDVAIERARASLDDMAAIPTLDFPRPEWAVARSGFSVERLRDAATRTARPTALLLSSAVGCLLLITCVNLTILFLARAARRRGELAMRAALGAGRERLAKQLVTESLLVTSLGGVAGLGVARLALSALVLASPPTLPGLDRVTLDAGALLFAVGLTVVTGVLVGVAPLVTGSRRPLHEEVHGIARGATSTQKRAGQALVVGEVAAALVLLVGAGLLVRTTDRLFALPLGFDPDGPVVMQVYGTGLESGDETIHGFFDEALSRVRDVAGVRSVAMTSQLPLQGPPEVFGVRPARSDAPTETMGPAFRYAATPGYFDAMGIRLVAGRFLEPDDVAGNPRVAVVSRSLARRLFAEADPIGRMVGVGAPELDPFAVVGVVEDVQQESIDAVESPAIYTTPHQWHWADRTRWFVVEGDAGLPETVRAVREAIWAVDADQPIVNAQTLAASVADSESLRRFVMLVLGAFASLALALAAVGLYGVLSASVAERMSEMGVRAAIGASSERILTLVLGEGMRLTGLGVAVGFGVAAAARGIVQPFLFGVSSLDPATYAAVAVLVAGVAVLACLLPGLRAAGVDPLTTLKSH